MKSYGVTIEMKATEQSSTFTWYHQEKVLLSFSILQNEIGIPLEF